MSDLAAPSLAPPVGLIGEPLGNVATEQPGTAIFPSTAFEGQDWFGLSSQLGRGLATSQAELGTVDDYGRQVTPPEPPIGADEANKTYGIPGKLTFSAPVPASVAQSMNDAKRDEIAREDAAARAPPGFWPNAARMGAGFVAGALDPTNLAALFVPGLGEARTAGMLARAGLPGLGGDVLADVAEGGAAAIPNLATRTAVRGVTGAIGGMTAQAPLVALHYGLSQQEQGDYSALDALGDVMTMGAGLGALGHAGFGLVGDVLGQRFVRSAASAAVADDPATAAAATRTAVAQMVAGNPVEVDPVITAAQQANERAVTMARVAALSRQRESLLGEAAAIPEGIVPGSPAAARIAEIDAELGSALPATSQDRLDAINGELAQPGALPAGRSERLLAERHMLWHGNPLPLGAEEAPEIARRAALEAERGEIVALEHARSVAQRAGLLDAATRTDEEVRAHLTAAHAAGFAAAEQAARDAGLDPQHIYGAVGLPRSLEDLEREYRQSDPPGAAPPGTGRGEQPGGSGAGGGPVPIGAGEVGSDLGAGRREGAATGGAASAGTSFDAALSYAHGEPLPEETAATHMVDAAARATGPDGRGGVPAGIETQLADIHDALARADAAGLIGEPERAEMAAANGWIDQAKNYAQGVLQAAACIARGMV